MRITLTVPRRPFAELAEFGANIPAAVAAALNDAAFDARKELVDKLPTHFVIRGTWTARGMRVEKADKRTMTAKVGSTRPYMGAQAKGGERPDPGGGQQIVPVGARRQPKYRTTPKTWPKALEAKGAFVADVRGTRGIWLRTGKRKKGKLRLMWRIVPKVTLQASWPMEEEVYRIVQKRWKHHCTGALKKARDRARQRRATG